MFGLGRGSCPNLNLKEYEIKFVNLFPLGVLKFAVGLEAAGFSQFVLSSVRGRS